jgi:metallo-beta-lactamase family protein
MLKIQFVGAAHQVTGSCYDLEGEGIRLLVDCGLHQERDTLERNWDPFPFDPASLDVVLLTHVHLDHSGLLPRLVREGFSKTIITTQASQELLPIVLQDSAHIQEEDAAFKLKRHAREGRKGPHPEVPLYTTQDAQAVQAHVRAVPYEQRLDLPGGLTAVLHDAGHILGSAMIELIIREQGQERRVIFSGDIGQWDKPIVCDPTVFAQADDIIMESTYGDRDHQDPMNIEDMLAEAVSRTIQAGGNLVIPTFAMERAQDLLYFLGRLLAQKRIGPLTAFLDSPMAVDVTAVFERHQEFMDKELQDLIKSGGHPFRFPGLHLVRTPEESKAINAIRGSCLIMAGSGMCNGGRIKHHLTQNITRPECTILFVGYQAQGTLGRQILEGRSPVRIHGQLYPVKARIAQIQGFSAHADRKSLLRWLGNFQQPPRKLFLVHGEPQVSEGLAAVIRETMKWPVVVPGHMEQWNLA